MVTRGAAAALFVSAISAGVASAAPADAEIYCQPTDPDLAELSGLTSIAGTLYAIGDSGADSRVAELGVDCAVERWIDVPVDPYDVEDLTSYEGSLWLADIGDNQMRRDTVSLTRLDPDTGVGELHRLTYPDGAHDAETVLIEPGGRPVIVTKDLSGVSGVYVPTGDEPVTELSSPGPTPLRKVGVLPFTATDTVGGPPFVVGSILATGGAVSADAAVAAIRTYTDAYLFTPTGGDIASALVDPAALRGVLPLPDQPQGEAMVFGDDGSLLLASEAGFGPAQGSLPPILGIPDALARAMSTPEFVAVESVSPTIPIEQPVQKPAAAGSEWEFRAAAAAGVVLIAAMVGVTVRRWIRSRRAP